MKALYVALIYVFVVTLIGCGGSDNSAPIIEDINASKTEIAVGEEITINVVAKDLDGDNLFYEYDAGGGEVIGSGAMIKWRAQNEGTYIIKVIVKDDYGYTSQSSIIINVKGSQAVEIPIMVNLQVTEYKNPEALQKVMAELEKRNINKATVFVGKALASSNCDLIKGIDQKGYEVAGFGYALDDAGEFIQLNDLSKAEQQKEIGELKTVLENCLGHRIDGFRSQRFSQNSDTNQIVKELGFRWHGSFLSGRSFLLGHENDVSPYFSSEYGFYVIPMLGVEVQPGRISALCDTALNNVIENPSQWKEFVKNSLVKKSQEKLPFLTEFHPYLLVEDTEWWNNFIELIDWIAEQDVEFVTTIEIAKAYCITCQE